MGKCDNNSRYGICQLDGPIAEGVECDRQLVIVMIVLDTN